MTTVAFRCDARISRIGAAICAGDSAQMATWYSSGWKR
jgi:hypothetical protein